MFIGVSGLIGVGKSTFTDQLTTHLASQGIPWKPCYEPVDALCRVQDIAGRVTETTIQAHGKFAVSTYRRRIGGMNSIHKAIR